MTKQKVYDTNNWKSASASGHGRILVFPVCHRLTFTSALGVKFQPSERLLLNDKSIEFGLTTVERINKVLGAVSLARFQRNGDINVVSPWWILSSDIIVKSDFNIEKGTIVIPIKDFVQDFYSFYSS